VEPRAAPGPQDGGPAAEWQDITPYYEHELAELYYDWLARKGMTAVPRLEPAQFASASEERFETELFLYGDRAQFLPRYAVFLEGHAGKQVALVGGFTYGLSSYPMLSSNSQLDIIDTHGPLSSARWSMSR